MVCLVLKSTRAYSYLALTTLLPLVCVSSDAAARDAIGVSACPVVLLLSLVCVSSDAIAAIGVCVQ